MATININGVTIYYEVHGEGEPLVLIHHGIGCTEMWKELLPGFTRKYKVVLYDRRGFGKSEKGEDFGEYYLGDQYCRRSVEELAGLLEHLNIDRDINIIGQCEGGAIGFHYAAQHPERMKTMVSSSTLCYSKITTTELCKDKIFPSFEEADLEFQEKISEWHGATYAPELYSLFVDMGGFYGAGIFDLREVLQNVKCPTLVLYPDRSALFDVEQAVLMYRSLPEGELAVLPNCGHNTYEQQPEDYQRIILSFLERHR